MQYDIFIRPIRSPSPLSLSPRPLSLPHVHTHIRKTPLPGHDQEVLSVSYHLLSLPQFLLKATEVHHSQGHQVLGGCLRQFWRKTNT